MKMRLDYPNGAEPGESYSEYIARKKAEKSSTDFLSFLFKTAFSLVTAFFVYCPLLYVGYVLATKITHNNEFSDYTNIGLTILFAYILYAAIFFIKGLLISYKIKGNWIWVLLWLVCVLATCLIPAFVIQGLLEGSINPSKRMLSSNQLWTWSVGILFGLYVYSRYKFRTDFAPKIVFWSYSSGFRLINKQKSSNM